MEISADFNLLPWKLVEASMEVILLPPRKLVEASLEVDGNVHGRTLKKQNNMKAWRCLTRDLVVLLLLRVLRPKKS